MSGRTTDTPAFSAAAWAERITAAIFDNTGSEWSAERMAFKRLKPGSDLVEEDGGGLGRGPFRQRIEDQLRQMLREAVNLTVAELADIAREGS